jgi:hypothetical protein
MPSLTASDMAAMWGEALGEGGPSQGDECPILPPQAPARHTLRCCQRGCSQGFQARSNLSCDMRWVRTLRRGSVTGSGHSGHSKLM